MTLILGYTRAGHEVLLPTHQTPDMAKCVSWAPGDHLDASRILMEHGERSGDPIGDWCSHWASAHWALGKSARRSRSRTTVRGAAETTIRVARVGRLKRR